ncbi:hypothetical protein DPMN_165472 [Dreissena polymorpha]|uniref:Uncharacterized protein n=1 Tax=Dreissena polymorpha TaxID=45954 RepID=A0A9D4EXN5_DREPO|nr:hypothetical protein DPMN_165472 [Dreissena polymorpha]
MIGDDNSSVYPQLQEQIPKTGKRHIQLKRSSVNTNQFLNTKDQEASKKKRSEASSTSELETSATEVKQPAAQKQKRKEKKRRKLKNTGVFINEDLTRINLHVLMCIKKKMNDEVQDAWTVNGSIRYKRQSREDHSGSV